VPSLLKCDLVSSERSEAAEGGRATEVKAEGLSECGARSGIGTTGKKKFWVPTTTTTKSDTILAWVSVNFLIFLLFPQKLFFHVLPSGDDPKSRIPQRRAPTKFEQGGFPDMNFRF